MPLASPCSTVVASVAATVVAEPVVPDVEVPVVVSLAAVAPHPAQQHGGQGSGEDLAEPGPEG